ncbi:MAG: hydrogenase subunit MbhD domain-containing protein [Cyanobacteriota bacterium]|nr:hydrogenase subunit MbhD domain-containing protein [Cyanobacteriota bacterium]
MSVPLTLDDQLDLLLPITALLPLTAVLLVSQNNPYQTLVLRGILGSVATLLYALLGAPDVAITEALVGTLLSTTLYAVALRSSMALRLEDRRSRRDPEPEARLSQWMGALHLRLRLVHDHTDPRECHGWLEDGGHLVLRRAALLERLRQSPGYQAWLEAGGALGLEPGVQT